MILNAKQHYNLIAWDCAKKLVRKSEPTLCTTLAVRKQSLPQHETTWEYLGIHFAVPIL